MEYDFVKNISFKSGLSIHDARHFSGLLYGREALPPAPAGPPDAELYFETDDLDELNRRFVENGVEFIHPVREQPWGQRVLRAFDPDRHAVEIGETMSAVIRRFLNAGLSVTAVAERTAMPPAAVLRVQQGEEI